MICLNCHKTQPTKHKINLTHNREENLLIEQYYCKYCGISIIHVYKTEYRDYGIGGYHDGN